MTDNALNIQEFNTIAGLVFAQLYDAFPAPKDIDRTVIANAMGAEGNDWGRHILPSGRSVGDMLAHTIGWLKQEGYFVHYGARPAANAVLTEKGLIAMSKVPSGLKNSVGRELLKEAKTSKANLNYSGIGDLIGGIFGGFTKSIGSG
jgi:hypothetical protein